VDHGGEVVLWNLESLLHHCNTTPYASKLQAGEIHSGKRSAGTCVSAGGGGGSHAHDPVDPLGHLELQRVQRRSACEAVDAKSQRDDLGNTEHVDSTVV